MGSIITFYSYKGGVGRTMSVANIAILLVKMGLRVLTVDWDLEAPGLERYFRRYPLIQNTSTGLLDLLVMAKGTQEESYPDWREYVNYLDVEGKYPLALIKSGRKDDNYIKKLLGFNWRDFFLRSKGGDFIEFLRDDWKQSFDVVLIDSRTGITDSGGICTIQIPDILTIVFTANLQSLEGVRDVALRAQNARQKLAYDRARLLVFPLPSKFDSRSEFEESQDWLQRFSSELTPFYDWLPEQYQPLHVLERTKLPYIAYFSFGEKLPVVSPGISDPESLGYAYSLSAELIANNFSEGSISRVLNSSSSVSVVGGRDFVGQDVIDSEIVRNLEGIETDLIDKINVSTKLLNEIAIDGVLSKEQEERFIRLKEEIHLLNKSCKTSLLRLEMTAKILLDEAKAKDEKEVEMLTDEKLHLLAFSTLESLTESLNDQLKVLNQLKLDLEDGRDAAVWLDENRKRLARQLGREALKFFPDIQLQASSKETGFFCFSLNQFLEQIAHCLRWGRYDVLDSPGIQLTFDSSVYIKALEMVKEQLPSHFTKEARFQTEDYIDYLIRQLPFLTTTNEQG